MKHATFGIVSENETIKEAAPIAKWMIGKSLKEIKPYLKKHNATVKEIEL